jgi:predicted RecB family nuclease
MRTLLDALPPAGQIVVYNATAERTVINLLGRWLGGALATQASGVANRLFDLLPVVRGSFAHPSMLGSFSLKKVAPAMLERGYSDLDIQDGMAAVRSWRQMIDPGCLPEDRIRLDQQLRTYCGRDAELMHAILERLRQAST